MRFIFVLLLSLSVSVFAKPDLMGLQTYDGQDVSGWLVSEKLDGVRAYWDGTNLLSRSGEIYHAPNWFIQALPDFPLDGELWVGRNQFETTVSIVRQHQPDQRWKEVSYQVFDVPEASGGLLQRMTKLTAYLKANPTAHIQPVRQFVLKKTDSLNATLNQVVAQGGEGLVIREPNVAYQPGRTTFAFKFKPKYDDECRVIGYTEGKGKYQGQVGALICVNEQNQKLKLGSGLTDAQRRQPPAVGAIVSYQYSGYTAKGWPKHAVFWRERVDQRSR